MIETIYKLVHMSEGGRLHSLAAEGPWSLLYEIGVCTTPERSNSFLFAYRRREDAQRHLHAYLWEKQVELYQANTSDFIGMPASMPILIDAEYWCEYWQWYRRGMPRAHKNPDWHLCQTSCPFMLCKNITLVQHVP